MKTYRVDKAWAGDKTRMRRFRMRTGICLLGWLPLVVAFSLFLWDGDRGTSILELHPAYRDIGQGEWLTAWLWIVATCAVFGAIVMSIFWRCPACRRFLGGRLSPHRCPHCDAKLSEPGRFD